MLPLIVTRPAAAPRTVSIHQPNFLPWLGFFHKIAHCDVFVLLDHVQFPKTGGCWTNHVKAMVGGVGEWTTVPIRRDYHGVRSINEICIDDRKPWRDKIRKTLEANYARSPHFRPTMDIVAEVLSYREDRLAEFNIRSIYRILDYIGWNNRKLVRSSTLGCHQQRTDLLIAISQALGACVYLSGDGAGEYQDPAAFVEHGITLVYQNFAHPVYPQSTGESFQAGLSIIDALFELGPSATAQLLGT